MSFSYQNSLAEGQKCQLVTPNLLIEVYQGDLSQEQVDAIAVPTDAKLSHGSRGAFAALARLAGGAFKEETKGWTRMNGQLSLDGVPAVLDTSGSPALKSNKLLAIVTPHLNNDCNGDTAAAKGKLKNAYRNIFTELIKSNCHSATLPGLSTGQYGIPAELSASAAFDVVSEMFSRKELATLDLIRFVDLQQAVVQAFHTELKNRAKNFLAAAVNYCNIAAVPKREQAQEQPKPGKELKKVPDDKPENEKQESACRSGDSSNSNAKQDDDADSCAICMTDFDESDKANPTEILDKCQHKFHKECIQQCFTLSQPKCPVCLTWYAPAKGNQPLGSKMRHRIIARKCPGFPDAKDTIEITYTIPGGVQTDEHLRPGTAFQGTHRIAYLPNNPDGRTVMQLLSTAFDRRLIFTVGDSVTNGMCNVAVWNNIHHKTSINGGQQGFGYPDATYLDRVKMELAAFGIVE